MEEQQLLKHTLKPDETVTIGRNYACDLVINSRYLSGKHCEVAMAIKVSPDGDKQRPEYTVSDTSSNGTWLLRVGDLDGDKLTNNGAFSAAAMKRKTKKLVKCRREELHPGDCIFLLAPSHEEFGKFQFMLMNNEDGYCILQQLQYYGQDASIKLSETVQNPKSTLQAANKRTLNSVIKQCDGPLDTLKKARLEPAVQYLDDQPSTSKEALRAYEEGKKRNKANDEDPIDVDNAASAVARPPPLVTIESQEECPMCHKLFLISELPVHCGGCREPGDDVIVLDDIRSGVEKIAQAKPFIAKTLSTEKRVVNLDPKPGSGDNEYVVELEQCIYCLKDFPVSELVDHVKNCGCNTEEVMEQCPHCSKMFPLTELYMHLLKEQWQMKESAAANYQALMAASEARLITNTEEFDCMICYVGVEPGEGVILKGCLHQFCKECLRQHVKLGEDAEVRCPHQDDKYSCGAVISEREIRELVSEEELQQLHRRGLRLAENASGNSFHCRTANCEGFCFLEDEVNEFRCPICDRVNCVLCKSIHEGMDCRQYQDELAWNEEDNKEAKATRKMLQDLVRKGKAMHCPKCRVIVQKREGCDWISCAMCKTEICWATKGPRWGPKGHGDISGGCKCNYQGRRCHPKCGNCH